MTTLLPRLRLPGEKTNGLPLRVALLLLVLANLVAVWGPDVLIHDDAANLSRVRAQEFPTSLVRHGLVLASLSEWLAWNVMALSKEAARLLYVLLLMVPLAISLWTLFRDHFGIPLEAALAGAVIPMILPAQWTIPAFINGSYVLLGLLAMSAVLHQVAGFAAARGEGRRFAVRAVLLFLAATQLMDQALFFFPLIVYMLLAPGARRTGRPRLLIALGAVFTTKAAWFLLLPRTAAVPEPPGLGGMEDRIMEGLNSLLPLPAGMRDDGWPVIFYAILVAVAVVFSATVSARIRESPSGGTPPPSRPSVAYAYGALLLWFLGNALPFIFASRGVSVRHLFIAGFGFIAAAILSLQLVIRRFLPAPGRVAWAVAFTAIAASGLFRQIELGTVFRNLNENQKLIRSRLLALGPPPRAQVAVYLRNAKIYWGDWLQSSGHLSYMLTRDDVQGCIGGMRHYTTFYDPFQPAEQQYRSFFRGYSLHRPLFLFMQQGTRLRQFEFALRWETPPGGGRWALLQLDPRSGQISIRETGTGRKGLSGAIRRLPGTPAIAWFTPRTAFTGKRSIL